MNIIYIIPSLDKVGPSNVLLDLVKGIHKYGYKITVLSFKGGALESEFSKYSQVIVNKNYLYILLFMFKNIDDIVHSHGFIPDFLNAICTFFKKYKSISTIHNFIELDYCFLKGDKKGSFLAKVHKLFLSKIQYSISCSKSAMKFNGVSEYYVFNGVSDKFNINSIKSDSRIKLVYLGSFNKRKNLNVILEAFDLTTNSNLELVVIGDGDGFTDFKHKYKHNNNIKFLGRKKEPFSIVNDCDYVVSSSLAEGFPLAILESLSCGLNYILSDIPPHREIHNMVGSGFLVSNNVNDFKICFDKLKNNLLGIEIQTVYKDKLTVEIMVDNYKRIYENKC
ncbi:TPA: glycosyltransferase family 4 protein [Photobacterium damselae]